LASKPDGSDAALSDPAAQKPTFIADIIGVYVVQLIVNDGTYDSIADRVTITALSELLDLHDFVLYADEKIKFEKIAGGSGHVGSNHELHIEKGACGAVTGDLRVLNRIKNEGYITIDGDVVSNATIDDRETMIVTGQVVENAELSPRILSSFSFSAAGDDIKIPKNETVTLAPGSYGRVEVKDGATVHLSSGDYYFVEFDTDEFARVIFTITGDPAIINVIEKLDIDEDVDMQIIGGGTRDVYFNYSGTKEIEIENRGLLLGTLNAPRAKVEFEKGSRLEGAVHARKIYLEKDVSFQFHQYAAPTVSISANPTFIKKGQTATLTWESTIADFANINHGVGSVPPTGSTAVSPPVTTTYTITVIGSGGTATAQTTVVVEDFYAFSHHPNELDNQTLTFTPDGTPNFYSACREATAVFPTDPTSGIILSLGDDDSEMVTLGGGAQVSLYGIDYSSFFVGSNGYITFTEGDDDYSDSFDDHFRLPRISGLFEDLFPSGAKVSWLQLDNKAVVTYQNVPEYGSSNSNSFQIEMFFDGMIRITYLGIDAMDGIAGLSSGGGLPDGFMESDLNAYGGCLTPLLGDFDADGDVDDDDRAIFEADFGRTDCSQGEPCEGDFDGDGDVDEDDRVVFEANFGRTDGPRAVPNVIGLEQTAAELAITSAALTVGNIATDYSDTIPAGRVLNQSPEEGVLVVQGASVSLVVCMGVAPPTVSMSASPEYIQIGEFATLSWTSSRADSAYIDQGIGIVAVSGSVPVSPTETTTYTITVTGPGGSASDSATITMWALPEIRITEPATAAIIHSDFITVSGTVDDNNAIVTVNGIAAAVADGIFTAQNVPLTLGENALTASATNPAGSATDTITVTYKLPPAPVVYITDPADRTVFAGPSITVSGTVDQSDARVWVNGIEAIAENGVFTASDVPLGAGGNRIMATASNQSGTGSDVIWVVLEYQYQPQPQTSFGAQYENLIPDDTMVALYEPTRFAVITGVVQNQEKLPISAVSVTIHNQPQYGTATTDERGRFSIPVEGGGALTLVYQKEGLITAHRKVHVPLNDITIAATIRMLAEDPAATTFTFDGNPNTVIVHKSTEVSDASGSRSTTMVFSGDNRAFAVDDKDQVIEELTTVTTRATEFTTEKSMPAKLPPNSAYTYCVEQGIDGVQRVRFEKPVITYVDNFLGFDVGMAVPVGYYDRDRAVWAPSDNGVVVKLLDTDADGIVDALDADGDDQPDDLNGDGSIHDEVTGLDDATKYIADSTYWRFAVIHFTPYDCNWPYGPPGDAIAPNPEGIPEADEVKPDEPIPPPEDIKCLNSYVKQRSRVFHEDIPIPGTGMTLHYASNRVKGYHQGINIPASGETVPASLKRIIVQVELAGQQLEQVLAPSPNQVAIFEWDGLDHLGNPVTSPATAHISIGFVYKAVYYSPGDFEQAFAQMGSDVTAIEARQEVISWLRSYLVIYPLAQITAKGGGAIADGWTLSIHHNLDLQDPSTLLKGNGESTVNSAIIIETVAGNESADSSGDGGPAVEAQLDYPRGIAFDAEGNYYIADEGCRCVRKVDTTGIITTVAGDGTRGCSGEGGLATEAQLYNPINVDVDGNGNLYILDWGDPETEPCSDDRILKVDRNGIIQTLTYYRLPSDGTGDPVPGTSVFMAKDIAFDAYGNLYIAHGSWVHRVRKIDPNGIISTVAGVGSSSYDGGYSGDGGPAIQAELNAPSGVAVDRFGNIYFTEERNHVVRKVDPSGIITTIAGDGTQGYSGDGGLAMQAQLNSPSDLELDSSGNLYIADRGNNVIRFINSQGIITTIAGDGTYGFSGDGGPAVHAQFRSPQNITISPFDDLFITDVSNDVIRKVAPISAFTNEFSISDFVFADNNGLGYAISSSGKHLKTFDLHSGILRYEFEYDDNDDLIHISDLFENQVVIQRENGVPSAIISPDGVTTALTVDPTTNHLTHVTYPDGSVYQFMYTPEGLLWLEIEPEENQFEHVFSSLGRLKDVFDPEGGHWTYSRTTYENGDILTEMLTAEGNRTSYLDHTDSTGAYNSIITDPAGVETLFSKAADGLTVKTSLPCGMEVESNYDIDPEYKFKYVSNVTQRSPEGLESVTQRQKSYQDTNADKMPDVITETVTVNGKAASLVQDTLNSQKIFASAEGRAVISFYDPQTLLTTSLHIPGLHDTTLSYDTRGRIETITTDTRQTRFAYVDDATGHKITVTDPEEFQTVYEIDTVDRLRLIQRPDGSFIGFDYDDNGNMTMLVNPAGIEHGFGHTKVNLTEFYHTPLSGSYRYIYDKDRQLKEIRFPSEKLTRNIYENGRLELIDLPDPENDIDLSYYPCGAKLKAFNQGGEEISYGYDGSLVTSITATGTLNQAATYTYNNDFQIETYRYAGQTENFGYDNDGLLTGAGRFSIARNVGNGLPETVIGGALSFARGFNRYGELDAEDYSVNNKNTASWSVGQRDGVGRILEKTESVDGITSNYVYSYDPSGRLLTVIKNNVLVEEYRYDPQGTGTRVYEMNALRGISGRVMSYSDEDHLLTAGDTSYQYDLDGFLTTKTRGAEVTAYTYSSRGELLRVVLPDEKTIEYIHDPLGRRIAKRVNGAVVEKYLWQGMTRLLAVYDGSDNLIMRFEYADHRVPYAAVIEGLTYYLTYDQVGSLRAVADGTGNVVKRIDYDSFGNITNDSEPAFAVPFGFGGGLYDQDTDFVRFGYRDYNPDIGRWTAKDPIAFAGGDTDLYGYVLNDPVNAVDIFGLFIETGDVVGAIAAGVITAAKQAAIITATSASMISAAVTGATVLLFPSELADHDQLLREYNTNMEIKDLKRQIEEIQKFLEPYLDRFHVPYDWDHSGPCP
jgi:RHS repeat-associated protein